jgi:uncharacterized protein (TIGR02646 family)
VRYVHRPPLGSKESKYLAKKAVEFQIVPGANYLLKLQTGAKTTIGVTQPEKRVAITAAWESARPTKNIKSALALLQKMAGSRQRCMYCVDSQGSDIDHFRPKAIFPEKLFDWENFVLSCTHCGRFKGNDFPEANGQALLINPTSVDPWEHLEFDPETGNLTARFDLATDSFSSMGETTVERLRLDAREGVSAGYLKTYTRIVDYVEGSLPLISSGSLSPELFASEIARQDDHGLLGWCLSPRGQTVPVFDRLFKESPESWEAASKSIDRPEQGEEYR